MRDINRIEKYLKELEKIWKAYPDLRFSQLIFNVLNEENGDYWKEEDETLKMFKEYYNVK